MTFESFCADIKERGGYETPAARTNSLYTRTLGRLNIAFYAEIWANLFRAYSHTLTDCFDMHQWARHSYFMLRCAEHAGGRATFTGFESMKNVTLPAVFVANHMSMLETLILPGAILPFTDMVIVLKASLLRYPCLGKALKSVNPISVNRTDPREDLKVVLEQGEAAIRAGRSAILFPQSTRTPYFDPAEFNTLGIKLAKRAGVHLVPVAVQTNFQAIGQTARDIGSLDRSKPIRFHMGPQLKVEGNGRAAHEQSIRFIQETLHTWGIEIRETRRLAPPAAAKE